MQFGTLGVFASPAVDIQIKRHKFYEPVCVCVCPVEHRGDNAEICEGRKLSLICGKSLLL